MADTPYYAITLIASRFLHSLPPLLICPPRHAAAITLSPLFFSCRHY
jgi:hypothetical protein